jgi:hypothetical protein
VEDAAKALLEVGSYANYVKAQSETALRRMASVHPYDLVEAEDAFPTNHGSTRSAARTGTRPLPAPGGESHSRGSKALRSGRLTECQRRN